MAYAVSKIIFEILCENQGCLDYSRITELLGRRATVAKSVLLKVLSDNNKFAVETGKEIQPHTLIAARTDLRICQETPGKCQKCDKLHLCRYFVCGNCRFGNTCKHSHDLASQYNAALLVVSDLQDLTEKQLFQLLLQNDAYLLPEICPHYNRGNSEHGFCKFTTSCIHLHICQHFLQGDCKFGVKCKRAHTFNGLTMKILNGRGLSRDNIQLLNKIYKNKFIIKDQLPPVADGFSSFSAIRGHRLPVSKANICSTSDATTAVPTSEADRNEICLYFVRKHCSFQEKCVRVHYKLPYKWQVLDVASVSWKDLEDNEDIEQAFCDPAQNTSAIKSIDRKSVDFQSMTYGGSPVHRSPVRRLSTVPSISKPHYFILTTEWQWYWQADKGRWVEYGQEAEGEGHIASVNSQTLERAYESEEKTEIGFSAGKNNYNIYLKEMYQQNLQFKTRREVRRRPRFVSGQEVEAKRGGISSGSATSSSPAEAVPPNWDQNFLPSFGYKRVPLSHTSQEYQKVEKLFKGTMQSSVIRSIERIQNPSLWKIFQWQKAQMKEKNGGKPVEERYLFHGTDMSLRDAICEQNFDWRVCGVHGTAYGKGSYFARDASYSDRYVKVRGSLRSVMFVAHVLVGEFTNGSSSYVRPPAKGSGKGFYDSCVDQTMAPSIFVVFDKLQIYPEYIIEYEPGHGSLFH